MIKLQVNKDKDDDDKKIVNMNLTPDIIMVKEALEYYDLNQNLIEDLTQKISYIEYVDSEKDFEHNKIILYDSNQNEILQSKYEYIGTYDSNTLIWSWAWSIPTMKKKNTTILRKILNYGVELEPTQNFLKTELITSRFRVTNKIQLDIYSAIVSYLSKKPKVIRFKIYNYYRAIRIKDSNTKGEDNILIDIINPLIDKNLNKEEQYRYTEYYVFLLD